MQIGKNKVVTIDYTLTGNDGEVLDSSKGRAPLEYLHGHQTIIPGLEAALEGKSEGEILEVVLQPEEAYGVRNEALVQAVPLDRFQGAGQIVPGMQFEAESSQGVHLVTVVAVEGETVTVDANHPLAGQTLNFDVKVMGVRDATAEEMNHGHIHGPGGHHHE